MTPSSAELLERVAGELRRCGRLALCHIVRVEGSTPGKPGWRLLVRPDGSAEGNLGGGAFEALVVSDARERLADRAAASEVKRYYFTEKAVRGEPTGMVCGGMAEVFLEVLTAPPVLMVMGGGPVGQAIARVAAGCELEVVVADDRASFREPQLFPPGTTVLEVDRSYRGDFLRPWLGRQLLVAIVTRCWETDSAALEAILRAGAEHFGYVGLMGSKRKIARVLEEVRDRGLDPEPLALHAPIGLPLGGDSPGEIAVAVVAEIQEWRYREKTRERPRAVASLNSLGWR